MNFDKIYILTNKLEFILVFRSISNEFYRLNQQRRLCISHFALLLAVFYWQCHLYLSELLQSQPVCISQTLLEH